MSDYKCHKCGFSCDTTYEAFLKTREYSQPVWGCRRLRTEITEGIYVYLCKDCATKLRNNIRIKNIFLLIINPLIGALIGALIPDTGLGLFDRIMVGLISGLGVWIPVDYLWDKYRKYKLVRYEDKEYIN